jgi:hypothetical protein
VIRPLAPLLPPEWWHELETTNAIGPCVVTADAIDPYPLTTVARVNGEELSRGSSATVHCGLRM